MSISFPLIFDLRSELLIGKIDKIIIKEELNLNGKVLAGHFAIGVLLSKGLVVGLRAGRASTMSCSSEG